MNCGPRALCYVHRAHGQRLTLAKARQLCGTTRDGTFAKEFIQGLEALKYKAFLKENLDWVPLKDYVGRGYDVFVSWYTILSVGKPTPPEGHWSVALWMGGRGNQRKIALYDPDPEQVIVLPWATFFPLFFDYEILEDGTRKDFLHAAVIAKYKG